MQVIVPSKAVKDTIEKYANNIHVVTTGIKIPNLQFYNPYPADGKMHLITMCEIHKNFHKKKLIHILYEQADHLVQLGSDSHGFHCWNTLTLIFSIVNILICIFEICEFGSFTHIL